MTVLAPGARTRRGAILANFLCHFSILAWCAGLPATKDLVAVVPPVPLTMLRMALAGTVLVALWLALEGPGALRRANWGQGVIVGAVAMGVGGLGMTIALDLTDTVTVAIITASMPIIGLAFEVMFDGRRITAALVVGVVLGLIGGIVALDLGDARPDLGWGALAALVSVFGFVWGSRATVTHFPDLTALGRTAITVAGASIAIAALALAQVAWQGSGIRWDLIGPGTAWSLFLSSVVAVALAQTLWILGVERVGIGVAGMHNNVGPFYIMVITLALGGLWNWTQALGAAIVILGVLVAQDILGRRSWSG